MIGDSVEAVVARQLAAVRRELELERELAIAELRAELHLELAAITRRIDDVHTAALRELTRRAERMR